MEDQQKELKKPNQEEHDGEAQAASDDEDADAAPRMTRGRARHWECHSPDSDNGSGDNDEPEDWVDFLAVQREQLEEERARLKQKPKKVRRQPDTMCDLERWQVPFRLWSSSKYLTPNGTRI